MKNVVLAAVLVVAGSSTVFAEATCGARLSDGDVIGEYTIGLGPGTLTVLTENGGQRVHSVPERTGTATIFIDDGEIVLYSDDIADGGVLEIVLAHDEIGESDLSFMDNAEIFALTADELAFGSNCSTGSDLPVLTGVGSVTGNGVVVPNSVQLLVPRKSGDGILAIGVYNSGFSPPDSDGTIILELRLSLAKG